MALLAFLDILGAIGWLWIAGKPIINLMVFTDRNFHWVCADRGGQRYPLYKLGRLVGAWQHFRAIGGAGPKH